MSTPLGHEPEVEAEKPWWFQPELGLLIVLVLAAYFVRLGDVSIRGEEPTRAQIAFEMMQRGDWIVPREQGEPFLSRPPLQNWLIAASSLVCGSREPWALRLPSALAMLATTLLIYGYSRTCLSRPGALSAAIVFATFGEMFTMGAQAETEMVFIALVSASLLLWHWGHVRGWSEARTWIVSYVLVGLAVLCKGPQPPVYFLGSVTAYLLLTGQWRRLFSWAHLAGALAGAAVVLAWLIPCIMRTSWPVARAILMNDTANRFQAWTAQNVGEHLVRLPLETLGCTLPWSLLLFGYVSSDLRRSLGKARPQALFMGLAVGLAFMTIWLPPNGETRYFSPLYPCVAVLIGAVIETCVRADAPAVVRAGWRWFTGFQACLMTCAGLAVVGAAIFLIDHPKFGSWAESLPTACGYCLGAFCLAIVVFQGRRCGDIARVRMAVLALACFMVLISTGLITSVRIRRSEDQASAMARLKAELPPGQKLVSFGTIDSLFAYYYALPIERLPMPVKESDPGCEEGVCFCFMSWGPPLPTLPFGWHQLAAISMARNRGPGFASTMVVGRCDRTHISATSPPRPGG